MLKTVEEVQGEDREEESTGERAGSVIGNSAQAICCSLQSTICSLLSTIRSLLST
jgi:hypothetical protein